MDNGILIIGIAAIMYLVIVFFISLYYLIKNYDKKPEYCEKDDKIYIGVYESGTNFDLNADLKEIYLEIINQKLMSGFVSMEIEPT